MHIFTIKLYVKYNRMKTHRTCDNSRSFSSDRLKVQYSPVSNASVQNPSHRGHHVQWQSQFHPHHRRCIYRALASKTMTMMTMMMVHVAGRCRTAHGNIVGLPHVAGQCPAFAVALSDDSTYIHTEICNAHKCPSVGRIGGMGSDWWHMARLKGSKIKCF